MQAESDDTQTSADDGQIWVIEGVITKTNDQRNVTADVAQDIFTPSCVSQLLVAVALT